MGSPPPAPEDESSCKSSAPQSQSRAAPAKAKEEEKPAPKPATGGFLFSFGAEPEKPKEPEKPAPKQSGFLFSLPGAEAEKPKEAQKPAEAPAKPDTSEALKKYAKQIDVLHGMGFLDDNLLVAFLDKNKGSVDDVLSELLG